jgi:hypothetical protein
MVKLDIREGDISGRLKDNDETFARLNMMAYAAIDLVGLDDCVVDVHATMAMDKWSLPLNSSPPYRRL